MSSGLPPILAAPTTANQQFTNPFSHFGYLFGQAPPAQTQVQSAAVAPPTFSGIAPINRFKVKRHRQRVDAGEPRNTYQGTVQKSKIDGMMQMHIDAITSWKNDSTATSDGILNELCDNEDQDRIKESIEETSNECEEVADDYDDAEEDEERNEKEENRESPSSSTSSAASKRKCFQPQKIEEQLGIDTANEPEQINVTVSNINDDTDEAEEKTENLTALQQQLSTPAPSNAAQNIFETQKKIYAAFVEHQRRTMEQQSQQPDRKINYEPLVQNLKNELFDNITNAIEKIVKDWATNELSRLESSISIGSSNVSHIPRPAQFHPIFPIPNHNPLAAFQIHNPPHPVGNGIFPPNFNAFTQLQAFNALRRNFEEEGPKKKRIKLTETPKAKEEPTRTGTPLSAPASPPIGHATPLNRYFPPTMVGNPFYNGMSFNAGSGGDREDSPTISDEMSDCLGYDGNGVNSTLTPMHLRKAKLMFFYTRYPNSNLLKTYFPDIRFNKNNTAQLVKWFSNFREFYYNQMEKFARQLLAEGVQTRDDIFVTKDSELFKILNTHYNRNNHIKPPDRLVEVVQETLREFFDAIKLGKDAEPSWKKTIYKIINRMEDSIPDFFKEPNFLELLES